jgi:hypothetical protein
MINVLVSTTVTQGAAPGDFCWLPEGELVARYGVVCASERPDGSGCGCGRAFAGLITHKARQKHDETATHKGSQVHPVQGIEPFQILDAVFASTSTHVTEGT